MESSDPFIRWIAALEAKHFAELTFPEVSRALRALSSTYVERRQRLAQGAALSGAGKRAAFALFYGPLHHLLVRHIAPLPRVIGIDRHPWALAEAAETYRVFGISAIVRQGDAATATLPKPPTAILAAFTLNELAESAREALLPRLLERARQRDRILIVEPLAGFVAPWWHKWRAAFEAAGGRADEWRLRAELPPIVEKLDRAAGLNHREITGRSLWLTGH